MMNRRDTILIAVLINAGLLVILFATAMTGDSEIVADSSDPVPVAVESPKPSVGEVLKRYVPDEPKPALVLSIPSTPAVVAEAPKITPKVAPKPQYVSVTVKRGDSLDKLARQNGVTIAALMQINGLTDSRLQIGQELRVPLSGSKPAPAKEVPPTDPSYYVVESGDNPWLLATKLHIPLDDLLELNQLDEERARRLKPGDKIRIK